MFSVTKPQPHVAVCVCTYRRPQLLKKLLEDLKLQQTCGLFTFSAVVADNDQQQSAQELVCEIAAACTMPVRYCWEPEQNIALARNKAVENATGDYIAFIDDDEFPAGQWLLYQAMNRHKSDGILGPVLPVFEIQPPT